MHPVLDNHCLAERQPRLRAIPIHEFVDCMPVSALSIRTRKAVEDGGLRDLEVRQSQDRLGSKKFFLFRIFCFMTSGLQSPLAVDRQVLNRLGRCSALSARGISNCNREDLGRRWPT